MNAAREKLTDIFCAAIELKDKKRDLYEKAMKTCGSEVATQTFKFLKEAEEEHLARVREAYEALNKGKTAQDACKYHDFGWEDKKAVLRKIAKERDKVSKACVEDVVAVEQGMELENRTISLFTEKLGHTGDTAAHEFLDFMISEDREHYRVLADLRFYYKDPESWFMEKGRSELDGAGAVT